MPTRNQLRELLREEQEPFHLRDFIADRRREKLNSTTIIYPKQSSSFTKNICRKACFFSATDSPNAAVSSPRISTENLIWLHVPARTAQMLLETSERINKPRKSDPKRLRTIGSFLKKLRHGGDGEERGKSQVKAPVKEILKWESSTSFIGRSVPHRQNPTFSPEIPAINCADQNLYFESEFRSSPFRFVLHSPSTGHGTLDFSSTPDSPSRADAEEFDKSDQKDSVDQCVNDTKEEEHCSPVSVLDPDPYQGEDSIAEGHEEDDDHMYRSYAKVHRAQEKLLEKLSRFERLAGLDPLELEIRFEEDDEEDYSDGYDCADEEGGEICKKETESLSNKRALSLYIDQLTKEILNRPEFKMLKRVPGEVRKVIKVVSTEEERELDVFDDKSVLLERVVRRLSLGKEVAYVIAGLEMAQDEVVAWKHEQVSDTVMEIELGILGALMEELWEDHVGAGSRQVPEFFRSVSDRLGEEDLDLNFG